MGEKYRRVLFFPLRTRNIPTNIDDRIFSQSTTFNCSYPPLSLAVVPERHEQVRTRRQVLLKELRKAFSRHSRQSLWTASSGLFHWCPLGYRTFSRCLDRIIRTELINWTIIKKKRHFIRSLVRLFRILRRNSVKRNYEKISV